MIQLDIVTPSRKLLSVMCESVVLPGAMGEFEVLQGHTPFLTALKTGVLQYRHMQSGNAALEKIMVAEGFAEADNNLVTVLVEAAATPSEVNVATEEALIAQLEAKLKALEHVDQTEFDQLKVQLERAAVRMQIV